MEKINEILLKDKIYEFRNSLREICNDLKADETYTGGLDSLADKTDAKIIEVINSMNQVINRIDE